MLYLSAISTPALELLKELMSFNEFSELRLVGGTALALQIGHRKSIDLDLFGKVEMDKLPLAELFAPFKTVEIIKKSAQINIFEINEIISFYNQKYFDASTYLAIKSLTYFDDAEQDMDLDMLIDIDWEKVKDTITKEVVAYTEKYM